METESQLRLDGLSTKQIERCASILARRVRLDGDLAGNEAADFIHEAVTKVLSGERSLQPERSVEENLVGIGQSLVWNERKKAARSRSGIGEPAAFEPDLPDPDLAGNLQSALGKARTLLEGAGAKSRTDRDAHAFLACLLEQIDRRESIRPGVIADRLGWRRARAYAAWRRVKAVLARELRGKG